MSTLEQVKTFPVSTGIIGTVSGWASYDLLRTSQIAAGFMAATVSFCTLLIVAPKAYAVVCEWCHAKKKRKRLRRPPLL